MADAPEGIISHDVSATGEPGVSRVARASAASEPPVELLTAVVPDRTDWSRPLSPNGASRLASAARCGSLSVWSASP